MHAFDALEKGHLLVIKSVEDLPETEWDLPGACGNWSVKEIIAHLASYEQLLIDLFNTFLGQQPTPLLNRYINKDGDFNATEVGERRYQTAQQIMNEYNDLQVQSTSLLQQIPDATVQQAGTLPWYGPQRSLADLIDVIYGHAREHCAQIALFREEVLKV